MISIQDMKKLRDIITDRFGISPSVAGRVIGYYNGSGRGEIVAAMIAGDLSGVGPTFAKITRYTRKRSCRAYCGRPPESHGRPCCP